MLRFWWWLTAQPQNAAEEEYLQRYVAPGADWHQRRHALRMWRRLYTPE